MINTRFLLVCIFFIGSNLMLHSEAPELKNVIPNSWQKVTRLTAEEEQEFVQENKSILQEIEEFSEDDNILFENGFHYVMYQEIVGEDIFYRVLCTENDEPDFLSPEISFTQYLVYENKIVTRGPYNSIEVLQRYTNMIFYSIDVIQGNAKAKGVLNTAVRVRGNKKNNIRIWDNDAYRKEQLRGLSTECYYYLMSEVNKMIKDEEYATVSISASDCLVDPNIPLRYSLQNAFDGDPATSYVENTEDDLMQIDLTYANYEKIKKIAVINGYTQNLSLYNKNNRVQSIGIESLDWNEDHSYLDFQMKQEIPLIDHNLSYQIANVNLPSRINVISKYNGSDYSDTCIAELNMYAEENGWMFGGME